MSERSPRLVVFTTVFPRAAQPTAGLFIRERMFRVGRTLPIKVVCPVPWFPLQALVRRWKPHFRPPAPRMELQNGVEVRYPRFFSVPGRLKWLDGFLMALACLPTMWRLRRSFAFDLIDAHFAYPDGYAATLLGRWLGVPVCITLRGTEVPLSAEPRKRARIVRALSGARRVFAVSDSLKRHAVSLGVPRDKILVVGNGVDTALFKRVARGAARASLGLPQDAPVLISVGALVERKGLHRVMETLPELGERFPGLRYLVVGGPSPEGDWSALLRSRALELGVQDCVGFLGPLEPAELKVPLSAADVFVLATRNEGWANVFLEAMACGLPLVTTDVGGNSQVVANPALGMVVPFGHRGALTAAIDQALRRHWDQEAIVAYAASHSWDRRVETLVREFHAIAQAEPAERSRPRPAESA